MARYVLGISAFYHDSAAALISDGNIVAAAQQERFSRIKHDSKFPTDAINYCLSEAGIDISDIECVVFYENSISKLSRLIGTYVSFGPNAASSFNSAMISWLPNKLRIKTRVRKELRALGGSSSLDKFPKIITGQHHLSHAASAFFPSPYSRAAVLCMDGVGEWDTTSAWVGDGSKLKKLWSMAFPHSIGLFYSAFTQYLGFKVDSGEYKMMGLAPYGEPKYVELILNNLIDVKLDGTFRLDLSYFDYLVGSRMISQRFEDLFGCPARIPETAITQKHMDIACSVQAVTELVIMRLANTIHKETGAEYLCLAGGVALNCVANGLLSRDGPYREIWIQPAAGDAGGAVGAALAHWHQDLDMPRPPLASGKLDGMSGGFLGPEFSSEEIMSHLEICGADYEKLDDDVLLDRVAGLVADEKIVGWMSGRMEFGPRAMGARSILGDPRSAALQSIMNLKIKFRESFRPFAPSVLSEFVDDYFDLKHKSPYMLLVADVNPKIRTTNSDTQLSGFDRLSVSRSSIPAVTHVDYSSRVQTVHRETNPRFYNLIQKFQKKTGCAVIVNTSFNVRGEPIVCSPTDAYRCFMRTGMDYLVVGNFLMDKLKQPLFVDSELGIAEFSPD